MGFYHVNLESYSSAAPLSRDVWAILVTVGFWAPYLFNDSTRQFITFNDERSVKEKCMYVKEQKMGGVMFWEYSSDPKGYLLNVINTNLKY